MSNMVETQSISIRYRLEDLPTAFHKAGLAGLVMLIQSLASRGKGISVSDVLKLESDGAEIQFSENMLAVVMNDLYDSKIVEVRSKSKWQGATPKREETVEEVVDGKTSKTKFFVYDATQPVGRLLQELYPDGDGLWLKLWRDMLWSIPRSRPTTRIPFNSCAEKGECNEGANAWKSLLKYEKGLVKEDPATEEISSALLLGAQALTAENVPFIGRVEQNLLLHFWPLIVSVFVPVAIQSDGSTEFAGFALAIPEVSNLLAFVDDYRRMLEEIDGDLTDEQRAYRYRPRRSVVELPAESALSLMMNLGHFVAEKSERSRVRYSIRSVEYMQLVKVGNNVKTVGFGRIAVDVDLLDGYRAITRPGLSDTRYFNSLFRKNLIQALLDPDCGYHHWYRAFANDLLKFDTDVLLRPTGAEEKTNFSFAADVARKFRDLASRFSSLLERNKSMNFPHLRLPTRSS